MPRLSLIQTNFTAGEISPRARGRVDIARYQNGAEILENCHPVVHGGAVRRGGLRFVAEARFHNKIARLIPFVFSRTEAYVAEVGDGYMRPFKDRARITEAAKVLTGATQANPVVVSSTAHGYANGDQVYISGVVGMTQLNGRTFKVANVLANSFELQSFDGVNIDGAGYSAYVSGGTAARAYTTGSPYTEAQLRDITYTQGENTMFMAHSDVAIQRMRRFSDTYWDVSAAPFLFTPFAEIGTKPAASLTLSDASVGTGRTFTASSPVFLGSDIGREITSQAGVAVITGTTSTTVVTCTISVAFPSTSIASGAWTLEGSPQTTLTPAAASPVGATTNLTLSAAGWRSEDVGKFVQINGGLLQIQSFTSTTVVVGKIKRVLTGTTAAPASGWSLEATVWSSALGYPRAVTLFQQRLLAAGSNAYPQTVWGSVSAEYLNFLLGANDDDAFAFPIGSDQVNPITHLAQTKALIALTYGGEFSISGGPQKAITPTNILINSEAVNGCNNVRPSRVGNELLFIQRAGKKLRSLGYRFDEDAFKAPDITILGEHITGTGVVDMTYQQERDSMLWLTRADGYFASLTFEREQDVIGFARHSTDGQVISCCSIPNSTGDETWFLVKRVIVGVDHYYIEVLDETLNTDCAITGTHPTGAATWTGLWHLEGKTVDCVADGVVMGQFVVANGQITLPRNALAVEIGLHYDSKIKLLPPEVPTSTGVASGNAISVSEVTVRLLNSLGCTVDGDTIPFRRFGQGVLDEPIPPFTGDKRIEKLGWDRSGGAIPIEQKQPLPMHVLAVMRKVTIND